MRVIQDVYDWESYTLLKTCSSSIGDFYLTKHSNLAEVHAVFHLVTDDNLSNLTINSRHPIMIGVRNIMMAASRCNITNLVIPLLLVHEMSEVNVTIVSLDTLRGKFRLGKVMNFLRSDGNIPRRIFCIIKKLVMNLVTCPRWKFSPMKVFPVKVSILTLQCPLEYPLQIIKELFFCKPSRIHLDCLNPFGY